MAFDVFVGIDVSKDKVDVACRGATGVAPVWERTEAALKQLCEQLLAKGRCRVVLEASGGYERLVLAALSNAGIEVFLLKPVRVRHFAKSLGRQAKTDAIDAAVLARMAEVAVEGERPWQPREDDVEQMRQLVHRRQDLVAQIDAETKRLRAATIELVRTSLERSLAFLRQERDTLESRMRELAQHSECLGPRFKALTAVVGIGIITAATLLAEVPELGTTSRNEIAALVGVAPMARESGKWTGQRFVIGGRTRARCALYMAAIVAARWNEHLRAFYERLVAKGKAKKLALVAVMRKLLIHLNTTLRTITNPPEAMPIPS